MSCYSVFFDEKSSLLIGVFPLNSILMFVFRTNKRTDETEEYHKYKEQKGPV